MFCNVRKGTRFHLKLIIISLLFHPPHAYFVSRSQVSLSSSSPAAAPYTRIASQFACACPMNQVFLIADRAVSLIIRLRLMTTPIRPQENNFHTLLYSIPRTAPSFIKAFCVKSSRAKCECPSISLCCSEEEMFHTVRAMVSRRSL